MKNQFCLFAATALISSAAFADVTISIPDTINVLVVNDASPKLEGGFFSASKTLTLPDGENQILFQYQPYFDQGNDRVILESDPLVGTFNASNTKLEFALPKYRNENQARKQISHVEWSLVDESGNMLETKQDKLVKDGFQLGRNHQIELAEYNRQGGVAALSTVAATAAVAAPASKATPAPTTQVDSNTAEEMLHFWYNKADAETQARFKAHINNQ